MKLFFSLAVASLAACLVAPASAGDREFSVFDLELGKPFEVRECRYEIVTVPFGQQGLLIKRTRQQYQYIEVKPEDGKCFKREGFGYTTLAMDPYDGKALPLPPAGPLVNGDVKVIHADSLRPGLVGDQEIWVRVAAGVLQAVKFYFPTTAIEDVHLALEAKYGAPTRIQNFSSNRGRDGRIDYYIATWVRPKLTVVLTSLDVSPGMSASPGYVHVSYGTPVRQIEKNQL
jgi:hypothetical protein